MKKSMKFRINLFLAVALGLLLYITVHETGHLIVMLYAGVTIDEFSILGAHVSGHGGAYTDLSDLWLHANGALLPVLLSYGYILFYKENSQSMFYRFFSWFVILIPACSLLAWVFIPFMYMSGTAPKGDDVTDFLFNFSQSCHPLIVSVVALLFMVVSALLAIRKRVLQNFIEEVRATAGIINYMERHE